MLVLPGFVLLVLGFGSFQLSLVRVLLRNYRTHLPDLPRLPEDTFGACVVTGDWELDEDHPVTAEDKNHIYARRVSWLRRDRDIARFDRDILPQSLHNIPDLTNAQIRGGRPDDLIEMARVTDFLGSA